MPRRDRILPKEVRWRGSKCVSRVLAPLVPDGAAPRTQESHPSTLDGLGAHNERFNWGFPLDATPLGGDYLTSGLSTATTRAPSVSGVIGRLLAPRRAPPKRRDTHGLHLREGRAPSWRAVRRTRAPRSPLRARHVPVVHAERGREEHGVHGHRPRPRGSRAEHGAHACRRSLHPCTRLTVRGSRAQPQTTTGTYGTSARRGPGRCGWAARPVAIAHAHEDPALRLARPCAAPHRVPCGAPGGEVPPQPPQARTARARRARRARAGRPYGPLHPHSGLRGST